MGKKVEKALSKDKHPSSAVQHEDDDPNKTPEPYKCTGNFATDFTELCKQNGMAMVPGIVLKPKPPAPPAAAHEGKADKKGDRKQTAVIVEPEPEVELNEDGAPSLEKMSHKRYGEPIDPPPKTYTVKDKFEYFKPCVQVELDSHDKWETVSEVHIKGWKIDGSMMEIFHQCWPTLEKLHTINLWNTGLTEATLHTLATFLPQCANLKTVCLDGNPVKEENWSELLGEDSLIQSLSLRHCKITDKGAIGIGRALGSAKAANTKLVSLSLAGNLIGDVGAESLAGGLRMNRTLMSLALTSNEIGNKGAEKLAEALSRFPLSHEEVVERRKLMSDRGSSDRKSPPPSRRAESKDRPGSVRSMTTQDKSKQKPSAKKKDTKGKDAKEDTKTVKKEKEDTRGGTKRAQATQSTGTGRTSSASSVVDTAKTQGKTKDKKKDKGKSSTHEMETVTEPTAPAVPQPASKESNIDGQDAINPLLEPTDYMDGQSWIAGNRTLINLNLSRNQIEESGMAALLRAIQYQTTLTLDNRSGGTGLMRLVINKNAVAADNEIVTKLTERMVTKDPFYKPPTSPEGEAA